MEKPEKNKTGLPLLLLVLCATALYSNTILNDFVYDDEATVVNNLLIRDLYGLGNLFSGNYFNLSGEASYRPLVTFTYMTDYSLWGLDPAGYHLTNLLLHLLGISTLYIFAMNIWGDMRLAVAASALFALSPVNSEAVNAISFREELLITPLCLMSLTAHRVHGTSATSRIFRYGAPPLYFLALLSKEMAVSLPFLAIATDYYIEKRVNPKRYAGYAAFTLFYLFLRFYLFKGPDYIETNLDFITRVGSIPQIAAFYLQLLLFPVNLAVDYGGGIHLGRLNLMFLFVLIPFFLRSEQGGMKIAVVWFLAALLPVLNMVPVRQPVAVRYLYFPSIGFSLLLSFLLLRLRRACLKPVLICLVLLYSLLILERNRTWKDNHTLWTDTIKKAPGSYTAHINLGIIHRKDGRLDDAIREYRTALSSNPYSAEAHNNIGYIYLTQGRTAEAKKEFKTALELKPDYFEARANLALLYSKEGLFYYKEGRFDEAVREFRNALDLDPSSPKAHNNLGSALFSQGAADEAIKEYRDAVAIKPDYSDARFNLGLAYLRTGDRENALKELRLLLTLDPRHEDAGKIVENLLHVK